MPLHRHLTHFTHAWNANQIFFITTCTHQRKQILADSLVANILIDEWRDAYERHGWMVGRYVIMPDHVHFFCSFYSDNNKQNMGSISKFMQQWKQWTSKRIIQAYIDSPSKIISPIWQKEFFDHLLRSAESYSDKWEYVRENPIRKKLVSNIGDWPWQGEIFDLRT